MRRSSGRKHALLTSPDPECVECGRMGRMIFGAQLHPGKPALENKAFYVCPCGAWTGCHPGTGFPVGRPAGSKTRRLRVLAHERFDVIWAADAATGKSAARNRAYEWLAKKMGLTTRECHFGLMDAKTLNRAIRILSAKGGAA